MIDKLKILLAGDTADKKLAIQLANHHTDNEEVMALMNEFVQLDNQKENFLNSDPALFSFESLLKEEENLFFEILEQDYAERLPYIAGLTALDFNSCDLKSLPESIGKLGNLVRLSCQFNELTSLLESIGRLKKLKVLVCSSNQLTSLPESIGELESLQYLLCSDNQLTYLPESIGKLKNLESISCSNNQLTSLPESLNEIMGRLYLETEGNPLHIPTIPIKQ